MDKLELSFIHSKDLRVLSTFQLTLSKLFRYSIEGESQIKKKNMQLVMKAASLRQQEFPQALFEPTSLRAAK